MLNPKYTVNPKLQYNYSNNNYIPDPRGVMACSVVCDDEFQLEWWKYFDKPQVWYISYICT